MKKIILSISAIFFFGMLSAQTVQTSVAEEKGEITFTSLEHDYGTLEYGANSTYVFEFTNTGKVPLVLINVEPQCGCTKGDWTKEPVKPGDKGKVTISYNTNLVGPFQKVIRVYSNAAVNPVVLTIKGIINPQVQPQADAQKQPSK